MISFKILAERKGYRLVEPLNNLHNSFGYTMILNSHGEVLKFYSVSNDSTRNAKEYLDYISLGRLDKVKYWLRYKRGSRGW